MHVSGRSLLFIALSFGLALGAGATLLFFTRPSPPPPTSTGISTCDDLYRLICGSRQETRDPTGSVRLDVEGELESLQLYEDLIRERPYWRMDEIDEEYAHRVFTPK